jgi:hypothetical protein
MIEKLIFLHHEGVAGSVSRETIDAGLGTPWQYIFILIALVIVGIILWIRHRRKKNEI